MSDKRYYFQQEEKWIGPYYSLNSLIRAAKEKEITGSIQVLSESSKWDETHIVFTQKL